MSSHEKLSAAANDRKARLAQLKSLKRKQAPSEDPSTTDDPAVSNALTTTEESDASSVTQTYLSGRNFDPTTRNVRLGFDTLPIADPTSTLEHKAAALALESKRQQESEKVEDAPLDLFKLQPKKPNWDLKRDLAERMRGVDVGTENAIARLVRERVGRQKESTGAGAGGERNGGAKDGEGEKVGMEGVELVEAMHLREREEEEERRREVEDGNVS